MEGHKTIMILHNFVKLIVQLLFLLFFQTIVMKFARFSVAQSGDLLIRDLIQANFCIQSGYKLNLTRARHGLNSNFFNIKLF